MGKPAFNKTVARRTRIAAGILANKSSLATYLDVYGSEEDLEVIRDRGLEAESYNAGQSEAHAGGIAGTGTLMTAYLKLLSDYRGIMNAVVAIRGQLVEADGHAEPEGDDDTLTRIDRIIKNEAAVHFRTIGEGDPKKMKASASKSQEAVRAEIQKDAAALLGLTAVHGLLEKRKVDVTKLKKLESDAKSLTGKVISRATKKGGAHSVTKSEREAVAAQSNRWRHCFRLLHEAAMRNPDIAALFSDPTE